MDKKNYTTLPKMIQENPRGLINKCILQMVEHKDSELIKSLTNTFKSYSGYKYLTCIKSPRGSFYEVKVHKESPMKPRSEINVPDTQYVGQIPIDVKDNESSPINIYMLRTGVYVFNQWQLLEPIGNIGLTVDQLGYELSRCIICSNVGVSGTPCTRCLSNICNDCMSKIDNKDKHIICPKCEKELEELKSHDK